MIGRKVGSPVNFIHDEMPGAPMTVHVDAKREGMR
jgi:hypothetical protein